MNKSAIVLVAVFWEAYCEDLASESFQHTVRHARSSSQLPVTLRKQVSKELINNKHDLAIWQISDDGWREVLQSRLTSLKQLRDRKLNTPRTSNIKQLFEQAIGVSNISSAWNKIGNKMTHAAIKLDYFVTLRGEIAHRGQTLQSIRKKDVEEYFELVEFIAAKTGGRVNRLVRITTGTPVWPTATN